MFCLTVPAFKCLSEIYTLYFQDRSAYSAAGKDVVDQSWEYMNCLQTHECGNWDRGRVIPRKGIHKWEFRCRVVPSRE
jgi:hypothetical protein